MSDASQRNSPAPATIELVVRRGALRRFKALKRKTAHLPVRVVWDRRTQDRRAAHSDIGADRRRADRRQAPPLTWELAEFVVVGRDTEA